MGKAARKGTANSFISDSEVVLFTLLHTYNNPGRAMMDSSSTKSPTIRPGQPSIRSFFQPRTPQYAAPPVSPNAQIPVSPQPSDATSSVILNPTPKPASNISLTAPPNPSIILPPQAAVVPIQQEHIQPLRRINSLLLEINYPDSFYNNILAPAPAHFSRAILWTDPTTLETKVIGGLVCRIDPSLEHNSDPGKQISISGSHDIYLQSLALLSPYRQKGLATAALQTVIAAATEQNDLHIRELYAHVWTSNEEGLKWYSARGFKRDEHSLPGYYRRLKPDTAWVLRRRLNPSDHILSLPTPDVSSKIEPVLEIQNERPGVIVHSKSFQDRRPDMEWNDLPQDVLRNPLLKPQDPKTPGGSSGVSAASSRSSSRSGVEGKPGKKKRQYPAAAFST